MPRLSNTAPNRILDAACDVISFEPRLAILKLETDDGPVEFAINSGVAAELAVLMVDFLAASGDDAEEAANDA